MKWICCSRLFAIASIAAICLSPVGWAEEQDLDDMEATYERILENDRQYSPFPPAVSNSSAVAPTEQRSWYKKLLSPFIRHASPPINQVPKVPKDKPRETATLPEPLIRLARGVSYEGKTVAPGFYLVNFQPGNNDKGPSLKLFRQQQDILTVPAISLASVRAMHPVRLDNGSATIETLPSPPGKPAADESVSGRENKQAAEEATATVEIAQNGETLILIYQQGDQQYASVPLNVTDPLQQLYP